VPEARATHRVGGSLGSGSPARAFLLARSRVLLARRHAGAAGRTLLFWPWNLLVRGPHDFLRTLLLHGGAAARAGVRGLLGEGGRFPDSVRAELGGEAAR
jgi:hypothetical protein